MLKRNYDLTEPAYEAMVERQAGRCAICGEPPADSRPFLAVDHDHATGRVRDLLCSGCNSGLANFREDPVLLQGAVAYLERHKERTK